jgi:hypothetical protein
MQIDSIVQIVPDFSSKLDLPSETVESIEGNHREIVRCGSRHDPRYLAISTVLKKCLHVDLNGCHSIVGV